MSYKDVISNTYRFWWHQNISGKLVEKIQPVAGEYKCWHAFPYLFTNIKDQVLLNPLIDVEKTWSI